MRIKFKYLCKSKDLQSCRLSDAVKNNAQNAQGRKNGEVDKKRLTSNYDPANVERHSLDFSKK